MSLKITRAGILETIQDSGRYGHQHLGINPGGAMDRFSASLANALLGKDLNSPVIEMHFPAAKILFTKDCVACISGADFLPVINGIPVSINQPFAVSANSVLEWNGIKEGARCYLSLLNELSLHKWLGSYGTNVKAGAGGFNGRSLQKDDEIDFSFLNLPRSKENFSQLPWKYNRIDSDANGIEFIPANEWNWLTTKSQTDLLNENFIVTSSSDRMGYRLKGHLLEQKIKDQLVSSAVVFGTVQLLPDGQLIILMADHQTTGGYPRIAHIISTSLSKLAQMKPQQTFRLAMTDLPSAEKKLVERQQYLTALQNTCNLKMQNWLNAD